MDYRLLNPRKARGNNGYMKKIFEKWWDKDHKVFGIYNFKKPWKKNGVKPTIKAHNNGAKRKNGDTCFDCTLILGYIVISYTNFDLQRERN